MQVMETIRIDLNGWTAESISIKIMFKDEK